MNGTKGWENAVPQQVPAKQATTFFVDKLTQLSLFLERRLVQPVTPLEILNIARDQAYFKTVFF